MVLSVWECQTLSLHKAAINMSFRLYLAQGLSSLSLSLLLDVDWWVFATLAYLVMHILTTICLQRQVLYLPYLCRHH